MLVLVLVIGSVLHLQCYNLGVGLKVSFWVRVSISVRLVSSVLSG